MTNQQQEQPQTPQSSFIDDLIVKLAEKLKEKALAGFEQAKPQLQLFRAKIEALTEQFMRERLGIDLKLHEEQKQQQQQKGE